MDNATEVDFAITKDLLSGLQDKPHFLIETQPMPLANKNPEEILQMEGTFHETLIKGVELVSY
jgi:hypothetical protein